MRHITHASFWDAYRALPPDIRRQADKQFALLKSNPRHPSLHFKRVGGLWSARVSRDYRALAVETREGLAWFWIGPHAEYDRLLKG